MKFAPKTLVALLAAATSVSACVEFEAIYTYQTGLFSAKLTDNGDVKCQARDLYIGEGTYSDHPIAGPYRGWPQVNIKLPCKDGYSAAWSMIDIQLNYAYGPFNETVKRDAIVDNNGRKKQIWTTKAWGCD